MTAGATGYPLRRFLPLSIAAGITWAAYSAVFGIVAGQWLHDQPLLAIVLAIVIAAAIGAVVDAVIRRILNREARAASAEPADTESRQVSPVAAHRGAL
jgi:membrane protein DedA with SNARE-associated domain